MSEEVRDWIIRRILVALDASQHSLVALETAAELAARLEAELVGLFVEDINLLRLAELPFAQELGIFSATGRRLDTQQVERQLQAQAERARRALATRAERAHVRWSFQVTRGVVAPQLLIAASEADLLILGRTSGSVSRSTRAGSTARAMAVGATCPALVMTQVARLRLPLLLLYDGSPSAQKAVAVAAGLVRGEDRHLIVFILTDSPEQAQGLKQQVSQWLQERGLVARYRLVPGVSVGRLREMIETEGCGTLVLPAQTACLENEELLSLMEELELPMLIVR
ncbi:MAG: universal stress protein [Chloroflexi bacterium]|nr:universal stress protein [Chloroflexota bacterium]